MDNKETTDNMIGLIGMQLIIVQLIFTQQLSFFVPIDIIAQNPFVLD